MNKVICPECGGRLTLESLCQYGLRQKVKPNGMLCKRIERRDHGSMEFAYLFCEACEWHASEEEFDFAMGKVVLDGGASE